MMKSLILSALALTMARVNGHDKAVIGYFTQYEAWKGSEYGVTKGQANQLNINYNIYNIINYSFFGVAVDGSLHSGDLRNPNIWKPDEDQQPGSLLDTDVYGSWDLHLIWGELEYLWGFPGSEAWEKKDREKVEAQGFEKHSDGWCHKPTALTGAMLIRLRKEGGALGLIDKAHQSGVKVMASIGGWSMGKHFPATSTDPDKKARMMADIDRLMAMGFDGIDIDWEYPGVGGFNFAGSEADFANHAQLLEDIRAQVGPGKLVTACFIAAKNKLEGMQWSRLTKALDYLNFMTYDLNGGWSEVAGHNAPLYGYKSQEFPNYNMDTLKAYLVEQNVPLSKVTFGAAYYGRGVTTQGTAALGTPTLKVERRFAVDGPVVSAADYDNFKLFEGNPNYNYLVKNNPELAKVHSSSGKLGSSDGFTGHWDSEAMVPYALKENAFLSYDNPASIEKKAKYVVDNGIGGIIAWQIHGDIECHGSFTKRGDKLVECSDLKAPLAATIDEVFSHYKATVTTTPTTTIEPQEEFLNENDTVRCQTESFWCFSNYHGNTHNHH
eukprot:GHVN01015577.1.p1 GENE.GHVN01015577.1~~GHVN01015577.1.p1  ORF type:complete len:551 (+),score=79.71 GHVN01015577.1:99-1751(+)